MGSDVGSEGCVGVRVADTGSRRWWGGIGVGEVGVGVGVGPWHIICYQ